MELTLRELLDKIYELEGLVHLALKRDDSSKDFLRLIKKKGSEINELTNKISAQETPEDSKRTQQDSEFSLEEYSIDEDSLKEIPLEEEKIEFKVETDIPDKTPSELRGKLVFSLNDRYRFRKELFNNSDVDFNTTLTLVASMEDYEEAEDYFINEEGFDRHNPVVGEFLEILKKYFK